MNRRTSVYFICTLFLITLPILSCESDTEYESLIREGLESGREADSLFLGYHFGMTKERFREHSMEMNQKGIITGFVEIEYPFDKLKSEAQMKFYPEFQDDRIVRIPVSVSYNKWAPWNKEYWPEELADDLKEYYEEEYNTTFYSVYLPDVEKEAYVSVEGNREIRIYRESEATVAVDFRNLDVFNLQVEDS